MERVDQEQVDQVMRKLDRFLKNLNTSNNQSQTTQTKILKEQVSSRCLECGGVGWVRRIDNGTEVYRDCSCREVKRMQEILEKSGISEDFQNIGFKQYIPHSNATVAARAKAIDYVMKFNSVIETRQNSIALLGQVGSGKTHLTVAIGNALMKRGIGVLYMPFRDVITELKQNMIDEEYYQKQVNRYKRAKVLLVDDLFKGSLRQGKINESDISIMFEIINHRYLNKAPIIVSSEYIPERLVEFDEGVGSRILHMCKDYTVIIEGQENNYRLKGIV
jgi:DNA replication protein DnaC